MDAGADAGTLDAGSLDVPGSLDVLDPSDTGADTGADAPPSEADVPLDDASAPDDGGADVGGFDAGGLDAGGVDAGSDAGGGPPTLTVVGAIVPLEPLTGGPSMRIFDQGLEHHGTSCAGTICVAGGIRP